MSNENKSIHEFDFNLICEYFASVERQGPGSREVTLKALSFIDNLNEHSRIADLGCGTGWQTILLGEHVPGEIFGLDLFPDFIDILNRNAGLHHLQNRIKGIVGSMDDLPFEKETLDLIWSEGAIYNIGFQRGLNEWWEYLKKGGYVAVSEFHGLPTGVLRKLTTFGWMPIPRLILFPIRPVRCKKPVMFLLLILFYRKTAG